MLIVNSTGHKEELHYMLEAVCVPGRAQNKSTLFTCTGKYLLLLLHIPPSFGFTNVPHISKPILLFNGVFFLVLM